jgi:hypothetical protein
MLGEPYGPVQLRLAWPELYRMLEIIVNPSSALTARPFGRRKVYVLWGASAKSDPISLDISPASGGMSVTTRDSPSWAPGYWRATGDLRGPACAGA